MADAGAGRHDAEAIEALLAPAQEGIALAVALVFHRDVLLERVLAGEEIDRHRMVDDEIDGGERIDLLGIALHRLHRIAHGGEIDDGGHAGEILHQHARRAEGDLAIRGPLLQPAGDGLDVVGGDGAAVFVAEQILEQDFQRVGQAGNPLEPVLLGRLQAEIDIGLAADLEGLPAFETVAAGHGLSPFRSIARENWAGTLISFAPQYHGGLPPRRRECSGPFAAPYCCHVRGIRCASRSTFGGGWSGRKDHFRERFICAKQRPQGRQHFCASWRWRRSWR